MRRQIVLEQTQTQFKKRGKALHGFAYALDDGRDKGFHYLSLGEEDLHPVYSVTKTVTSLVIGIAAKQCNVSLGTGLSEFWEMEKTSDVRWGAVTIEQLLTMSSGYAWNESDAFKSKSLTMSWTSQKDLERWSVERPFSSVPGMTFNYDSVNSHILSGIIRHMTGKPIQDIARQLLFEPLGIRHAYWETDDRGNGFGGHGLHLTLGSLLKLGEALLDEELMGSLVGDAFYQGLSQPAFRVPNSVYGYGYHTWTGALQNSSYFGAFGHGGQRIICMPGRGVLVSLGKIWPEFGPLDGFFSKWLSAEREA